MIGVTEVPARAARCACKPTILVAVALGGKADLGGAEPCAGRATFTSLSPPLRARLAARPGGSVKFARFPALSCVRYGVEMNVIELVPSGSAGSLVQIRLRPRRALTARQFRVLFAVLATATWAVALFGFVQGNAFAPAFALLDSAFVAVSLRWVWLRGERFEVIALGDRQLEVRQSNRSEPLLSAHPYWVRLRVTQLAGQPQVHLGSGGREVEVGSFLSDEERLDLVDRLKKFLAAASGSQPSTDHSSR